MSTTFLAIDVPLILSNEGFRPGIIGTMEVVTLPVSLFRKTGATITEMLLMTMFQAAFLQAMHYLNRLCAIPNMAREVFIRYSGLDAGSSEPLKTVFDWWISSALD